MGCGIDGSGRKLTVWNHARAILLLPFMNTVVIPAALLAVFRDTKFGNGTATAEAVWITLASLFLGAGLVLALRAITLFVRRGHGTLAPWDPTEILITGDIYRYSRNPMKAGLFLVLIGELFLLRSTALAIWVVSFIAVNVLYIRRFEEPGLRSRFGDEYRAYCRRVPRWLRLTPMRRAEGPAAENLS